MSNIDCGACNDLREYAPHFVQNGITSTECNSLKNDTGLNPSLTTLHTDCDDLNDVNDCLVGRMDGDLEAYETCDWKKFMHKFIPNVYETIKGIICALCGAWAKLHDHDDQLEDLCIKIDNAMTPTTVVYGKTPYNDVNPQRIIGELGLKNGNPLIIIPPREEASPNFYTNTGIGIGFVKKRLRNCTNGACRIYEWIVPHIYDVQISGDAEDGDILWYCSKEDFQAQTGMTDYLWEAYTISSWIWKDFGLGDRRYAWIEITVDPEKMGPNYITIVYRGTSYPNDGISTQSIANIDRGEARVYPHGC